MTNHRPGRKRRMHVLPVAVLATTMTLAPVAPAHPSVPTRTIPAGTWATSPLDGQVVRLKSGCPTTHIAPTTSSMRAALRASRRGVYVLGDSITTQSRLQIRLALEAAGRRAAVDSCSGRPIAATVDQLALAKAWHGRLPRTIVLAVGTNDCLIGAGPKAATSIDRAMRIIGPYRRAYWVNLWMSSAWGRERTRAVKTMNQLLADKQRQYANLHIIDWAGAVDARGSDSLLAEGVHLSPFGATVRSQLIARKVGSAPALSALQRAENVSPALRQVPGSDRGQPRGR